MAHSFRYYRYSQSLDFTGQDLISINGASREAAKQAIPCLVDPSEMSVEARPEASLTAYNGEIADEVHYFEQATHATFKLQRLMLKEGRVIEVTLGW